jgi:hypothetical protein
MRYDTTGPQVTTTEHNNGFNRSTASRPPSYGTPSSSEIRTRSIHSTLQEQPTDSHEFVFEKLAHYQTLIESL